MIRIAVVGLGWFGRVHLESVQGKSDKVRVVAASSINRELDEDYCRQHGVEFVPAFETLLGRADIDAIVLATPNSRHAEQVIAVAAAGKSVFCEKPFTLDLASAKQAVAAVQRAGVTLGVGFNRRFRPAMSLLREAIAAGRVGAISMIECEQTGGGRVLPEISHWRLDPKECPAGAMAPMGIHSLDAMIEFAGPVRELRAICSSYSDRGMEDTASVLLEFESGVTGHLFCSQATVPYYRMAVFGTRGLVEITRAEGSMSGESFKLSPADGKAPEIVATPAYDSVRHELEAFATAMEGGVPYPIPPEQILQGVAAFEAIVTSAATGKTVRVG